MILAVVGFYVVGDPEGAIVLVGAGVFGVSDGSLDVFGWLILTPIAYLKWEKGI